MSTTTSATEESIKLWLKVGNLKKLEQAVLDGFGNQLRGRNSRIPKINKFLKKVPTFQAKILAVHNAVAQGNLRELEILLDRKGLAFARGSSGETPFHTAVLNKQITIIKFMLEKFPQVIQARDHQGRTPLHYAALLTEDQDEIFKMLVEAGADKEAKDLMGRTPNDYMESPGEHKLNLNPTLNNRHQSREFSSLLRQPSPISLMTKTDLKSMIQKGDVAKIEKAILHGYGERLLGETAVSTRVRDLLESIPEHLNKLLEIDTAIESGSIRDVKNLLNRKELVVARDNLGLTFLHKAVLQEKKEICEYLISINSKSIFAKDHDKRTPVHYAAALADDGEIYNLLVNAGGNITLPDCDGKTPEYYRQNPGALDIAKVLEKRHRGSGQVSNSNSQGQKSSTKSGKRGGGGDPTALNTSTNSSNLIKQWLRSGDIERLEKAVIDGHGLKIIRETTADPRARQFLKTVPVYMAKITSIHEAACQGSLRNFKVLMDRKKLVLSRDQLGLGLLHKAVLFGNLDIAQFIVETYPETLNIKDKAGRTALHYAAAIKNKDDKFYNLFCEAGADVNIQDLKGRQPDYYSENEGDLDLNEIQNRVNRQRSRAQNLGKQNNHVIKPQENGFIINGANIRKWIHAEDISKLEQVILEGQGYKLLLETSNNPKVKHFLVNVPSIVNKIRELHNAVAIGDYQTIESTIDKPIFLLSKDDVGMTLLHKAVLLEYDNIYQFIVNTNSKTLQIKDEEGRTALHYAAGLKDNAKTYNYLEKAGADSQLMDSKGKTAEYYLKYPEELDMKQLMGHVNRSKPNTYRKQDTVTNGIKRQGPPNLRPVRRASSNAVTNETITKIIQLGDIEKLEQLVLDGYGKRLIGKSSWNEDVRIFLKKVPHYMDRIYAIHTAAALGDLLLLQQLLDKKKMVLSRDEYGLTALHKAVKYGQVDVVKYLLQTFPASHMAKDQDGRTPLHYAGLYKDRSEIYQLLINSGADIQIQDQRGKTPEYYFKSQSKLEAPTPPLKQLEKLNLDNEEEKKSEGDAEPKEDETTIQMWIDEGKLDQLEILVLEGRGNKLLGKSSEQEKVQEFLESVPAYMGKIRAVHNAAASGELKDLQQSLLDNDKLALSLDNHGACPLHRAVLHGHKDVMRFLANNYPISLKVQDKSGLTPLHYAALSSSDGYIYRLLSNSGADPNVKNKNGLTPGQMLRGNGAITLEDLLKRYEEKKVPPRPHSVQMWERPPTEEILKALTPSPMIEERASAPNAETSDNAEADAEAEIGTDVEKLENDAIGANASEEVAENVTDELADQKESDYDQSKELDSIDTNEEKDAEEDTNVPVADDDNESDMKDDDKETVGNDESEENSNDQGSSEDVFQVIEIPNSDVIQNDTYVTEETVIVEGSYETGQIDEGSKDNDLIDNYIVEEAEPSDSASNVEDIIDTPLQKENADAEEEETSPPIDDDKMTEAEEISIVQEDRNSNSVEQAEDQETTTEMIEVQESNKTTEESGEEASNTTETRETPEVQITLEEDNEEPETKTTADGNEKSDNKSVVDNGEPENKKTLEDDEEPESNENPETNEITEGNEEMEKQTITDNLESSDSQLDQEDSETNKEPDTDDNIIVEEGTSPEVQDDKSIEAPDDSGVGIDNEILEDGNLAEESTALTSPESDDVVVPQNSSSEETDDVIQGTTSDINSGAFNIFQSSLNAEDTLQWTKDGEYLTAVLGDALITALADVFRMKPPDPVSYLAVLLYRYLHKVISSNDFKQVDGKTVPSARNGHSRVGKKLKLLTGLDGTVTIQDLCRMKAEDGSTIVHYAAQKPHQNGSFFELLRQTSYNLAERDGSYRTARDIAAENGQTGNVDSIDRYMFYLVTRGRIEDLNTLILDGYDHILDILDDEGNDTTMIAELNHQFDIIKVFKGIPAFQEKLEEIQESIRNSNIDNVKTLLESDLRLARAKNSKGQTALHVAILAENEELIKMIADAYPSVVNIGDIMGRTPLHYAMGTSNPQTFAKTIIYHGGNALLRDVTLHMPSFYFIDNTDIQNLKDEMDQITV